MVQLVDFRKQMSCPSCDCALWFYHNQKDETWNYFKECFPRYCDGKKRLFFTECNRFYPHLHWFCKICKCHFVSETQSGQQKMKEITG